jgi:hypothetical protein
VRNWCQLHLRRADFSLGCAPVQHPKLASTLTSALPLSLLVAPQWYCPSARADENTRVDDERTPWEKRRSEQRKWDAALPYDLEMESRKVGWRDPALVYDEENDLFSFSDGRFAFSLGVVVGLCKVCELCLYRIPGSSVRAKQGPKSTDAPAHQNIVSGPLSEVRQIGPKIWPPGRCAELRKCPIVS